VGEEVLPFAPRPNGYECVARVELDSIIWISTMYRFGHRSEGGRLDILTSSQQVLLKTMCCLTASVALLILLSIRCAVSRPLLLYYLSTLNKELASPVSRRDALNAELASLAQKPTKYSSPPRGPGDRTGGTTVHKENCLLILVPF
jgi:hypothetical protein